MPRIRSAVLAVICVTALAATPSASARDCKAPPGTAAIDQYCETIPTASGDRGSGTGANQARVPIPGPTREQLSRSEEGQALVGLIDADGRVRPRQNGTSRSRPAGGSEFAPTPPAANPFSAVLAAIESGDTAGSGFVLVLLLVTVLMAGVAWHRARRRSETD